MAAPASLWLHPAWVQSMPAMERSRVGGARSTVSDHRTSDGTFLAKYSVSAVYPIPASPPPSAWLCSRGLLWSAPASWAVASPRLAPTTVPLSKSTL